MNHDRMSMRHRNRSCLGWLFCVGLLCIVGSVFAGQVAAQSDSGDVEAVAAAIEIDFERVESSTAETSFGDRVESIKQRIRARMTAEGATDAQAESIAASVAESIEADGCINGSCRIEKRGLWRWQRPAKSDRWYLGKVAGEFVGDVYWWTKWSIYLTFACPIAFVAFVVFAIAWLIFRRK